MKKLKLRLPFTFIFIFLLCSLWAQQSPLARGTAFFDEGKYQQALAAFREIILTSSMENYHSDAYFWIAKCYIATRDYDQAEKSIDFFLLKYPDHTLYPEGYYQKGRLLYLQRQYENAIQVLYGFTEKYRTDPYVANAYFWIGESLYELGHFDDAHKVFTMIVQRYPRSFKVEAAGYRISLIEFKYRENELLKLIKISHEEYLNALDEFAQREKSYESAIREYQQKLNTAMTADVQSKMDALSAEVRSLTAQNKQLSQRINELDNNRGPVSSGTVQPGQNRLFALKARGLNLKHELLILLEKEMLSK